MEGGKPVYIHLNHKQFFQQRKNNEQNKHKFLLAGRVDGCDGGAHEEFLLFAPDQVKYFIFISFLSTSYACPSFSMGDYQMIM